MKKIIFYSSAALLLGAASCSQEEMPAPVENGGNVNLTVALPGAPGTRAFADGLTADNLEMAVYDAETGNLVMTPAAQTFGNSLTTKVSLDLASGRAYKIAFFAHKAGGAYTFSAEDANIKADYSKMDADYNTDNYDCFYKLYETEVLNGAISETITLTRPVAQVNWGTSDLEHPGVVATDAYGANAAKLITKVTAKAYKEFSLLDSDVVEGSEVDVNLAYLARPQAAEEFPVEGDTYKYLSMQYLLVPAAGTVVDLKLEATNDEAVAPLSTVLATNAPVQANYRTNIFGALLTSPAEFQVTKEENFSGANNFGPAPSEVADASALKNILENSTADAEITITEDMDPNEIIEVPASETTREINIDKNGKELPKIIAGEGVVINIYDSAAADNASTARAKRARKATRSGNPANGEPTIWAKEGSIVNIFAGTFQAGVDANGDSNSTIYSDGGEVNIYGGYFSVQKAYNGKYYVLNVKNGSNGVINVYGGSFENQDPSKGDDAGTPASFLAAGSKVFAETSGSNTIYRTYAVPTTADAFAKALANGGDIMVESNLDLSNLSLAQLTFEKGVNLTLANNAKIQLGDRNNFVANADFTIKGQGTIDNTSSFDVDELFGKEGRAKGLVYQNTGTFTLDGVTLINDMEWHWHGVPSKGYAVNASAISYWNDANIVIKNGAKIYSGGYVLCGMGRGVASGTVTLSDSYFESNSSNSHKYQGVDHYAYAMRLFGSTGSINNCEVKGVQGGVSADGGIQMEINGGKYYTVNTPGLVDAHYPLYITNAARVTVNGGEFSSPNSRSSLAEGTSAVVCGDNDVNLPVGYVVINGGKFSGKAYNHNTGQVYDFPYVAIEGDDTFKWEVK